MNMSQMIYNQPQVLITCQLLVVFLVMDRITSLEQFVPLKVHSNRTISHIAKVDSIQLAHSVKHSKAQICAIQVLLTFSTIRVEVLVECHEQP